MIALRVIAVALIAAGVLGLAYQKVTYTEETHEAQLGPIEVEVRQKKSVDVPMWAGAAAIAAGTILLVFPFKK
jgi:hypothetical protein